MNVLTVKQFFVVWVTFDSVLGSGQTTPMFSSYHHVSRNPGPKHDTIYSTNYTRL